MDNFIEEQERFLPSSYFDSLNQLVVGLKVEIKKLNAESEFCHEVKLISLSDQKNLNRMKTQCDSFLTRKILNLDGNGRELLSGRPLIKNCLLHPKKLVNIKAEHYII